MHYYNLFVHFYFVKTVHSYFIIFIQGTGKNHTRNLGSILLLRFFYLSYAIWDNSTKSTSLKWRFSSYFLIIITYCRFKVHSHLNSKMEILTVFSILNSLFLPKMKISAVFSILNSFFLLKMEILTVFSILNML